MRESIIASLSNVLAFAIWVGVPTAHPAVADQFLPRAFERFTRPSSDRRGGTGLGLSIVRTIAVAHGGSVVAVNGERGGADVCVVLPALVRSEASHVALPAD